jgi:hypothetical protein
MRDPEAEAFVYVMSFVFLFAIIAIITITVPAAIDNWHRTECAITLGQASRAPADIKEICK